MWPLALHANRGPLGALLLLQSSVKNVFIRGSVVRYVHLPANAVDVGLLEDATRRGECEIPCHAMGKSMRAMLDTEG
jgi:hypothetical protein